MLRSIGKHIHGHLCLTGCSVLTTATAKNEMVGLLLFFDPGTQFPGNEKITLRNTKKYKNQAGMNLTPPPPLVFF